MNHPAKPDSCPTCGRPWPPAEKRVCGECHLPILKHHKFSFHGSVVKHRDCSQPDSYPGHRAVVEQPRLDGGA